MVASVAKLRERRWVEKLQLPNSKFQRTSKSQAPNTRDAPSSRFQARSAGLEMELGTWDFFGVWSLVFGVSIPGFLWSLVLGGWSLCKSALPPASASANNTWYGIPNKRQTG